MFDRDGHPGCHDARAKAEATDEASPTDGGAWLPFLPVPNMPKRRVPGFAALGDALPLVIVIRYMPSGRSRPTADMPRRVSVFPDTKDSTPAAKPRAEVLRSSFNPDGGNAP